MHNFIKTKILKIESDIIQIKVLIIPKQNQKSMPETFRKSVFPAIPEI